MFIRLNRRAAQSITEYAVLMGVVVLAIVLIQVYLKRSIQGKFKSTADEIGEQLTTGQTYTLQTVQQGARRENSGVGEAAALTASWADSKILSGSEFSDTPSSLINSAATQITAKLTNYAGHEITQRDFVVQNVGGGTVAAHTTFSSGNLPAKNPFTEAAGSGTN